MSSQQTQRSTVDEATVEALKQRSEAAFTRVFREFEKPVYSLAYRILNSEAEALDVMQDTFVLAFRRISQFRGGHFWSWLRTIAVNQALTQLRRQRRRPALAPLGEAMDPPERQAAAGVALDLSAAFARLGDQTRAVLWLYDVEGYSHQEIARLFDRSESFSKTQVSRAHKQLREWLAADDEENACPNLNNLPARA
ncbi:MAG: RNA polymerase sigma factor [Pseudomonadota bacterium]